MNAKEIKINEKTTKMGLINYLKTVKVSDSNLMERIQYALKMFGKDQTKVMKSDLYTLVQEAMSALTPAPVEASLKPKKKPAKAEAPAEEEETEEAEAEEEETEVEEAPVEEKKPTKKTGKKSSLKKSTKPEVETVPPVSNIGGELPCAKIFPKEIDHPELGKIVACTGAYTTYAEILKALEEEKTLYFAAYWTKRHIREYGYKDNFYVDAPKGGFPLDLDILMAVLPCETVERVYAMSRITEALYRFEGIDFKPIEDIDPRGGDKFQVRVASGMEFEIYRPADEEIVTID